MNRVWINPEKRRYYRACLQTDLFGDWTLTRCWGSLDSHHGQVRTELVDNQAHGLRVLAGIEKRRTIRGYLSTRTHA
jgi:hypothetical protein